MKQATGVTEAAIAGEIDRVSGITGERIEYDPLLVFAGSVHITQATEGRSYGDLAGLTNAAEFPLGSYHQSLCLRLRVSERLNARERRGRHTVEAFGEGRLCRTVKIDD